MDNLAHLIRRVREITGRFSASELTNDQIAQAINSYYTVTFPQQVKLDYMETYYEFITTPYQGNYPQPVESYVNFLAPAYCDNHPLVLTQNLQDISAGLNAPYTRMVIGTGDGETTQFTASPELMISPETLFAGTQKQTVADTNSLFSTTPVTTTSDCGLMLTVSYHPAQIILNFPSPPAVGEDVVAAWVPLRLGRPRYITMFKNFFYLRPVPDKLYKVKIQAYKGLDPLTQGDSCLAQPEWAMAVVYGAAKDLLVRCGESEGAAEMHHLLQEQLSLVVRRTQLNIQTRIPVSLL